MMWIWDLEVEEGFSLMKCRLRNIGVVRWVAWWIFFFFLLHGGQA